MGADGEAEVLIPPAGGKHRAARFKDIVLPDVSGFSLRYRSGTDKLAGGTVGLRPTIKLQRLRTPTRRDREVDLEVVDALKINIPERYSESIGDTFVQLVCARERKMWCGGHSQRFRRLRDWQSWLVIPTAPAAQFVYEILRDIGAEARLEQASLPAIGMPASSPA